MAGPVVSIVIPGKPISKDNEKRGAAWHGKHFTRKANRRYEALCRMYAQEQHSGKPLKGDLRVDIDFYFPDKRRCDLFNAPKSVCDALNECVWEDDKQIIDGRLRIFYDKVNPRLELRVYRG